MLTELQIRSAIRQAANQESPQRLSDGQGLALVIVPPNRPAWRFRYHFQGREKMISLGVYPEVSIAMARERREAARRELAGGIDPSATRQASRAARAVDFKSIAEELLESQAARLDPGTIAQKAAWLRKRVYPFIGRMPIVDVRAPQILGLLRKIEATGRHETARRVRTAVGEVMRYAAACGHVQGDPTVVLRGALVAGTKKSFAAVTDPKRLAEILRVVWTYSGQPTTETALKIAFYAFPRPGELRKAEWKEIDFAESMWRIPAEKMKSRRAHLVPLSHQVVSLLEELHAVTGHGRYVFPSPQSMLKPISDNTLVAALRRLGISKDEQTAHGVRAAASTLLNEQGWNPDLIELQLAHVPKDQIRAAYNRSVRVDERRKMLQHWADYLDKLRGGPVSPSAANGLRANVRPKLTVVK